MAKGNRHTGSNLVIIFLCLTIIYIDTLLSKNILLLLIPFLSVIIIDIVCKKCRNWTFRINGLFIYLLILLSYDFMVLSRMTYPNLGG